VESIVTIDAITCVEDTRKVQGQMYKNLKFRFVDLDKAFDRVLTEVMLSAMCNLAVEDN